MGDSPSVREAPPAGDDIAERSPLLHEPLATPPSRPFTRAHRVLLSLFLLYHAAAATTASLSGNTPGVQQARELLASRRYADITGAYQFWSMFAANPPQENTYLEAILIDGAGTSHDLQQDVRSRRAFPYLLYERLSKINRRMSDDTWWQPHYGAFLCRRWEREHGSLGREVRFSKLTAKLPSPTEVMPLVGFDTEDLPLTRERQKTIDCRTTPFAQLTPELRERFGLPPSDVTPVLPTSRRAKEQAR